MRDVENVIDDLKGEASFFAEGAQALHIAGARASVEAAADNAGGDERAGFGAVDSLHHGGGGGFTFAFNVEHLAADHAIHGAGGACNFSDNGDGEVGWATQTGEHFIGLGLQRIASEYGDGLAINDVAGGFAAAQIVVVERRQIVMHQRIGVQHLDGRAELLNAVGIAGGCEFLAGDEARGLHAQDGAQTLAASKNAVAHGAVDGLWNRVSRRQQALKRTVGLLHARMKDFLYVDGHQFPSYWDWPSKQQEVQ